MTLLHKRTFARSMTSWIESRFGVEIVPKWRVERHELAKHVKQVFHRAAVSVVIDVGANHGQYRNFLRTEVEYDGPIFSFEPVKALNDLLVKAATDDPNWHIHHCALGRVDGETTINVMRDDQFTSILQPKATGLKDYDIKNSVKEVQSVALKRLETVIANIPELASSRNLYLKIDTQGFDLEVFGGAGAALEQVVALQSEVSMLPLYQGMPDYKVSIAAYNEGGFEISGLFPIAHDQFLRIVEFDCVMVRPDRVTASVERGMLGHEYATSLPASR
jgi:FkbM family methyltransferase